MRISRTQMGSLVTSGGNVVGADGQKIGSIGQVYVDDSTGEPNFTQDQVYRPNTYTMATTTLSGEEVTRYFFRTRYDILVVPEV